MPTNAKDIYKKLLFYWKMVISTPPPLQMFTVLWHVEHVSAVVLIGSISQKYEKP